MECSLSLHICNLLSPSSLICHLRPVFLLLIFCLDYLSIDVSGALNSLLLFYYYQFLPLCLVKCKVKLLSHLQLFATSWTVAYQAPLSMGFSRQEYWSGLPFPSLGDLPNPGIKPVSPALQADTLPSEPPGNVCFMYLGDPILVAYVFTIVMYSWIDPLICVPRVSFSCHLPLQDSPRSTGRSETGLLSYDCFCPVFWCVWDYVCAL